MYLSLTPGEPGWLGVCTPTSDEPGRSCLVHDQLTVYLVFTGVTRDKFDGYRILDYSTNNKFGDVSPQTNVSLYIPLVL